MRLRVFHISPILPRPSRAPLRGFSLIELAVVLAILAVVAGGVLGIVATQDERNSRQVTQERLDSIEAALRRHAFLTQSLPCPARGNVAVTNADFGNAMADANGLCTDLTTIADPDGMVDVGAGNEEVRIGTVPTRTLNLPDAYMTDGWGDRFTYAMVKGTAPAEGLKDYSTAATDNVIQMLDGGNNQINDATPQNVVAYAIISHGKDRKGTYTSEGTFRICVGGARDSVNCDGNNVFMDTRMTDGLGGSPANAFDDMVRWKTISHLKPLASSDAAQQPTPLAAPQTSEAFITGGTQTSYAIDANRRLYSWGSNTFGKLGRGAVTPDPDPTPGLVAPGITDWAYIYGDLAYACGIRSNGMGYCWGDNNFGELGRGFTSPSSNLPVQIGGGLRWKKLHIEQHSCGLTLDGKIYCWGYGSQGQNGAGIGVNTSLPLQIGTDEDWTDVTGASFAPGDYFSCGIRNGGRIYCWGSNANSTFGNNATGGNFAAPQAGGYILGVQGTDWKKVGSTGAHICGLRQDRSLWCWGRDTYGQLGQGTVGADSDIPLPVAPGGWDFMLVNGYSVCGLRSGVAYCWGLNDLGQLGVGDTVNRSLPTLVAGGYTDWVSLGGDSRHICGYRANKTGWCWGENTTYTLGNGSLTNSSVPVPISNIAF